MNRVIKFRAWDSKETILSIVDEVQDKGGDKV